MAQPRAQHMSRACVPLSPSPTNRRQHPGGMLPHHRARLAHRPRHEHLKPVRRLRFTCDPGKWRQAVTAPMRQVKSSRLKLAVDEGKQGW